MKEKKFFNPNQSFFSLPIFQITAFTITLISISIATLIANSPDYKLNFNLSYEGFNNLLTIFKFPIGVAALLIPAIAILVANHRSEQTKAQMELTARQILLSEDQLKIVQKNNNFSNHYKHSDEFEKYIENYQNDKNKIASFLYPRELHSKIFPESKQGNYSVSQDFAISINTELSHFLEVASGLGYSKYQKSSSADLDMIYTRLSTFLNMSEDATLANARQLHLGDSAELSLTYKELLMPIILISTSLVKAFAFDEDHIHSPILLSIANFNPEDLPNNKYKGFDFKKKIEDIIKSKVSGPINNDQT